MKFFFFRTRRWPPSPLVWRMDEGGPNLISLVAGWGLAKRFLTTSRKEGFR